MRNPLSFFRGKTAAPAARLPRWFRAHFRAADAAPSIPDWWRADNLPADIDASPDLRRRLRMRSRFEVQNNSYAHGIVQTLANEYARQGKNWKTELEQIKKEQAYLQKLGLT